MLWRPLRTVGYQAEAGSVRAAVLLAPGRVAVRDVPDPEADGSVVVQVEQAGICGTDASIASGALPVALPRILGHEIVGRVVGGTEATGGDLTVGDRVLVDPSASCSRCPTCRRGLVHLCPHGGLMGRDSDGGLSELVSVAPGRLHVVPEEVDRDSAAILQVLGTCIHAHRQFTVFPGGAAVVVGLGVSGLLHVELFRARGIATVIGIGRSEHKRQLALAVGATAVATPEEAAGLVREITGGSGADVVVEAVGTDSTIAQAVALAAAGGSVVVFGTVAGVGAMPHYKLYHKEIRVLYPRAALPGDYDDAIALVASGTVSGAPIVSDRLTLAGVPEVLGSWPGDARRLKVVFVP